MPDEYNSSYTGPQIDTAVGKALNPDTTPTANSTNLITSGGAKSAIDAKADQTDLASIHITGSTNNTGASIPRTTYFYLNGMLVTAKASIANGATFTEGTNYEVVTAGALNDMRYRERWYGDFLIGTTVTRCAHVRCLFFPYVEVKEAITAGTSVSLGTLDAVDRPPGTGYHTMTLLGPTGTLVSYFRLQISASSGAVTGYFSNNIAKSTNVFGDLTYMV